MNRSCLKGILYACLISLVAISPTKAATIDFTTATITTNADNIVTTSSDGVDVTAFGYHAEFPNSTTANVYGPFPTSRDVRNSQYFGVETTLGSRQGIGLNVATVGGFTPTETDASTTIIEPALDNRERADGALPNIQFVLFTFSEPVDVSQIVVDTSNGQGHLWTASGSGAVPDLFTDFLGTLTALGVQTSVDNMSGPQFTHNLSGVLNIDFLLVGTTPRSDYGPLEAQTLPDSNFFIDELNLAPTVVPLPAAVWLFGSGLLGLMAFARKK